MTTQTTTATQTLTLRDGYSRAKNPETRTFRPMTPDEAREIGYGTGEIYFTGDFRTYRRCRPNGKPKTWKTRPDVELPIKYGMYEAARAISHVMHFDGKLEPVMRLPNGGILLVQIGADTSADTTDKDSEVRS